MIPLGFTPITTDYIVLDPPPSISSLPEGDIEMLNNSVLIPGETITQSGEIVDTSIEPDSSWVLTCNIDKSYLRPGDSFTIKCKITSSIGLSVTSGSVLIRAIEPSSNQALELSNNALIGNFNSIGEATIRGTVGSNTQNSVKIQFVAHLPVTNNIPNLFISLEDLADIPTKSNLVSLTTVIPTNAGTIYKTPPTPTGVPLIPLHDVVITSQTYTFRSYILDQEVELIPSNPNPRGSSGLGIYSDLNIQSPYASGAHNRSPIESVQNILGTALDELERIKGWSTKILGEVHSLAEGLQNSEIGVIKNLVPESFTAALARYEAVIEEAGMYAADTAETYLSDYSSGNTTVKSNAVEQHNVGQMRVQTASTYAINSPSITNSAQQSITQARFEHHAGDLYQASHIHYWLRAEDQYTCITNTASRYNQTELLEYSANSTYASGNSTFYADEEWNQVGQASGPLHPTNSRSIAGYGNSTKIVQKDLKMKSVLGSIILNAAQEVYIQSSTKMGFRGGSFVAEATAGNASIQSTTVATVRGESALSLSSSSVSTLDGSVVFINCGKAKKGTSSTPKIINATPRTFESMTDVAEYPRDTPIAPGPRGSKGNKTPEPGSTPVETNAGSWLTKHAPSLSIPTFNGDTIDVELDD